jgi:ribosome biogenesis GTPase
MTPDALGWNSELAHAWAGLAPHPPFAAAGDAAAGDPAVGEGRTRAARVIALHRGATVLHDTVREHILADHPGSAALGVAVGDWVVFDGARITAVLPRRGAVTRKEAGRGIATQVLAANLDRVLIVTSANQDLEPRRLDRMVAVAWEAGAQPVVVLSKSDLEPAAAEYAEALAARLVGVPVVVVHTRDEAGVAALLPYLRPGETTMLLGTSGVGKSTLLNLLAGEDRQAVREVRAHDDRGQHTTTHRELFLLPGDRGLMIDVPGIRELALALVGEGLERAFPDIVALAAGCRWVDCSHSNEPACAVQAAIAAGDLDPERLASLRVLLAEQVQLERRESPRTRHEGRRKARKRNLKARG